MEFPYEPDLDDRMRDMEPELYRLLTRDITSLGRWDALRFFLEMEQEQATMDEIGMAAGRDSAPMLSILGALTSLGWLTRRTDESGETLYQLTREQERRQLLDRFHDAIHDRTFRLQAMYHWTRGKLEE
ncbi:MAG: hypothetical protein M3220_18365 [Chloroflexota bacterium]|nr:hypothetical protein [Chloroflexota bacterium]